MTAIFVGIAALRKATHMRYGRAHAGLLHRLKVRCEGEHLITMK